MGRNIVLSAVFLIVSGGTGIALPDWVNVYDFYGSPSSGWLAVTTDNDIRQAGPKFSAVPNGGFGPPTVSFQNQHGLGQVVEPHPAQQFKDRWSFDYASGSHHPHHQHHHRRQWTHNTEG